MRQDRQNPPTIFGAGLLGGPSGAATDPGLTRPRCVCILLRRTRDIALTRPSLSAHTLFTALCLAAATAPLGRHHNTRTRFMLDHLTYHYHYGRGRKPWPRYAPATTRYANASFYHHPSMPNAPFTSPPCLCRHPPTPPPPPPLPPPPHYYFNRASRGRKMVVAAVRGGN